MMSPFSPCFLLLPSSLCTWNTLFDLQGLVPGASLTSPALFLAPHTHLTATYLFVPAVPSTLRPHSPIPSPIPPQPPKLGSRVISSKKPSLTTSCLSVPLLWASLYYATSEMKIVHFPA